MFQFEESDYRHIHQRIIHKTAADKNSYSYINVTDQIRKSLDNLRSNMTSHTATTTNWFEQHLNVKVETETIVSCTSTRKSDSRQDMLRLDKREDEYFWIIC